METYKIDIISAEVSKKMGVMQNVITHLIWQYIIDIDGKKESLCFRTVLDPPKKKTFIEITEIDKQIMATWIEASTDIVSAKIQLKEFFDNQQEKETYIFIPKV